MDTMRRIARGYLSLGVALGLVVALSVVITSCGGGGGGGGSDGGLCSQCGDTDGPCISPATVDRAPDAPRPCNSPPAGEPCTVTLDCFRKLDSAQRRCYPLEGDGPGPQLDFECDGSRPNPNSATPVLTPTLTPTPQVTATPINTTAPTFTPF